ncbi:hypothetical protein [Streptomyces hygroscopicus]|uniref:hypothetical protein n=1 Tax=Streptomyces hygroscopicus TaxID=1912 RepID=UPI0036A68ED6
MLCEKPVFLPGEDGYASQLRVIRASDRVFYPCHVYKYAPRARGDEGAHRGTGLR